MEKMKLLAEQNLAMRRMLGIEKIYASVSNDKYHKVKFSTGETHIFYGEASSMVSLYMEYMRGLAALALITELYGVENG